MNSKLHDPSDFAPFPIFFEASHPRTLISIIIISFNLVLVHLRIPLFLFCRDERLKLVLLAAGKVDGCGFPLGDGFGDEDVFDT